MQTLDHQEGIRVSDRMLELTTLPAPDVPATVRAMLDQRLHLWGLAALRHGDLAHDLRLCADELTANAMEAAPREMITFRASYAPNHRMITLSTWDASNDQPTVKQIVELEPEDIIPDAHALDPGRNNHQIGGWGLPLVVALSSAQGVEHTPPRGKWVWASFQL